MILCTHAASHALVETGICYSPATRPLPVIFAAMPFYATRLRDVGSTIYSDAANEGKVPNLFVFPCGLFTILVRSADRDTTASFASTANGN